MHPCEIDKPDPRRTWCRWWCITSFQLVYTSVNTGMGLLVLPVEATRFSDGSASILLGFYLALCGVTQLVCPVAGKISDRHRSKWGKRRPFIAAGGIAAMASFALMGICSWMSWGVAYTIFLFAAQVALNIAFSAQTALPEDLKEKADVKDNSADGDASLTKPKENAVVSGINALHSFCGALIAMTMVIFTVGLPIQVTYSLYMLKLAVVTIVVCVSATESSTSNSPLPRALSLGDWSKAYMIDKKDSDFFWVCIGRLFFYISTSSVVFLQYYIRDMLHVSDESSLRFRLGVLVISAQFAGAVFSVPFSWLSDYYGRKRVIYSACVIMAITFTVFIVAPKVGNGSWALVLLAGLVYGVGSGAYLSVDYALALDCLPLPSGKTTAEAFGLWGVAGFVGSASGPLVGGWLLSMNKISDHNGGEYGYHGYVILMFVIGCVMSVLVSIFTRKIQNIN